VYIVNVFDALFTIILGCACEDLYFFCLCSCSHLAAWRLTPFLLFMNSITKRPCSSRWLCKLGWSCLLYDCLCAGPRTYKYEGRRKHTNKTARICIDMLGGLRRSLLLTACGTNSQMSGHLVSSFGVWMPAVISSHSAHLHSQLNFSSMHSPPFFCCQSFFLMC
jgi:hypothetical protein